MPTSPDPAASDVHAAADPIGAGYHDVWGTWRTPSTATRAALEAAMGAPAPPNLQIVRSGQPARSAVTERAWLTLEDGTQERVRHGELPPDLPLGYHRIEAEAGRSGPHVEQLIVVPPRAHLPADLHGWGITAQLYAARSTRSWGMGDLGDLARLTGWAAERGASAIGLNPLHASAPGGPPANSPYSPSSRCWHDPTYLDVEPLLRHGQLPGADALIATGRALNASDRIDRSAIWSHKLHALELLWAHRPPPPAFEQHLAEQGGALELWGTYCTIAERHGPAWPSWPSDLQHPHGPAVGRAAREQPDRVRFWSWLQWLLDQQLATSGADQLAISDLAVGFAPDGFDAWRWQDLLATGCRIGAPPDLLGPDGQDWGLPPFVPWRLRQVAYRPFAETLRANLRHTRGLRIDHVMGLLRLFWIPPGAPASEGAYVSWTGTELLDIVALESVRAGALVVGEDLGTVEPGVRELLAERGLLSTRLLWFEDEAPPRWPRQAMAAVSTHDLPTIAGVWTGTDLADQRAAGVTVPADGDGHLRHQLRVAASCDDAAPVDDVVVAVHRTLGTAPAMLATATLDDLLGAEHRPNVPGTVDEHPNWRIPLPRPIDDLATHPLAEQVVDALRSGRS